MDIFLSALRQPARQTKYLGERQATRDDSRESGRYQHVMLDPN
jgi:hypothetical protein